MPSPPTIVSTQARAIVKINRLQETRPDYLRFSAIVQPTADERTGNPLFCRGFTRTDADGKPKNRETHGSAGVTPRRRAGGLKPCPRDISLHDQSFYLYPSASACIRGWKSFSEKVAEFCRYPGGAFRQSRTDRGPRLHVRPGRPSSSV